MNNFLQAMTVKAWEVAEEAQRALLASLNGSAAVYLLQGEVAAAVAAYRQVGSVSGGRGFRQ